MKYRESEGIEIFNVEKTLPFLEFPSMIEKRHYIYEYPENINTNIKELFNNNMKELINKTYTTKKPPTGKQNR